MGKEEEKKEPFKIIPIFPGEVHLQNTITEKKCYICKRIVTKDTPDIIVLRIQGNNMSYACLHHQGVVQEFVKQFKRLPLGWSEYNATKSIGEEIEDWRSNTV